MTFFFSAEIHSYFTNFCHFKGTGFIQASSSYQSPAPAHDASRSTCHGHAMKWALVEKNISPQCRKGWVFDLPRIWPTQDPNTKHSFGCWHFLATAQRRHLPAGQQQEENRSSLGIAGAGNRALEAFWKGGFCTQEVKVKYSKFYTRIMHIFYSIR